MTARVSGERASKILYQICRHCYAERQSKIESGYQRQFVKGDPYRTDSAGSPLHAFNEPGLTSAFDRLQTGKMTS